VSGQIYNAVKGDIILINTNLVHQIDAASDTTIIVFQFGLELFDQTLNDLRERISQKLVFDRKVFFNASENAELHHRIENLLLTIRQEYYVKQDGFRLVIRARLYDLAMILLREVPINSTLPDEAANHKINHQHLERIFSFIHDNYNKQNITLDQAAEAASLSKFYFTRFFRRQAGQTFHDYLSKVRVSRAEEYLVSTDFPVIDIMNLCGFTSLTTFNRLFKRFTGLTPSSYRSGERPYSEQEGQFLTNRRQ
jgi:AraC-like DNA-binding protein